MFLFCSCQCTVARTYNLQAAKAVEPADEVIDFEDRGTGDAETDQFFTAIGCLEGVKLLQQRFTSGCVLLHSRTVGCVQHSPGKIWFCDCATALSSSHQLPFVFAKPTLKSECIRSTAANNHSVLLIERLVLPINHAVSHLTCTRNISLYANGLTTVKERSSHTKKYLPAATQNRVKRPLTNSKVRICPVQR
jgi:hypothetical protein